MSKAMSIRLPDQLIEDAKAFAKAEGITVTDVIIKGIQLQLSSEPVAPASISGLTVKRAKKTQRVAPVPETVPAPVLPAKIQEKAEAKPWFRPCTKESQTYTKGKE